MKKFRFLLGLLLLCFIAVPINAHAQEMKPVVKNFSSKMTTSILPGQVRKSLSVNPGDYPFKSSNSYVGYLLDSYYTYHDLTFKTVASYSATHMNVQVLSEDDSYYKDPYITVEFLKNNAGTLQYMGATYFNTLDSSNTMLNSIVSKSFFVGQPYIYVRIGVSEYPSDLYYQDVLQFKVANPFYTPPVVDRTPPAKPTVYTVDNNDKSVSGKAEANSTIIVKKGSTTIGSNKANSAGYFTVTTPTQMAGTKLTVYAKDATGNQSVGTTVTVIDKTAPGKPTVFSVADNQTIINGTTEGNARVEIRQGTSVIGQITASSTGSFTIKLTAGKKAGTILTVYAIDKAGNRSAGTSITVMDVTAPAVPSIGKVTSTSTSITGKAEAGSGVYIFYGSNLIGQATSDRYGNFKAAIPPQKRGIKLEVLAIDQSGNQSISAWVTVN
ncbi:Ig-like domain-containing protein [Neobacillus vireti]|uniref:Ig-like domain-containing protein n=1 Tax=Neobacillus vireti TaxID=220686 RepID=UPI002FFE88CF